MFRTASKTDTVCSYPSGSIKTYAISEASSVLPAFSVSAFSLDVTAEFSDFQSSSPDLFGLPNRFNEGLSSSCKEGLDVFDNPEYTDTVKSNDSTGSILRRSLSLPRQYTYKEQLRKNVREVFEDFIVEKDGKKSTAEVEDEKMEWRQTMEDLLERPDYIDSLQSTSSGTALLAKTATIITKAGQHTKLIEEERDAEIRRKKALCHLYIKNLIILSLTCFFLFGAYLSLRNLQSSINADSSLAFYSLSSLYLWFFLGCICATSIIEYLRPKRTMAIAHFIFLLYVGTNFYPTYFTLLPASFLQGFALAIFWTAHSTYLASIGISYAQVAGKHPVAILTKFNGIFFTFFGCSQVLGNLISSTVLMVQMHVNTRDHMSQDDAFYSLINNSSAYTQPSTANTAYLITINNTLVTTQFALLNTPLKCGTQFVPMASTSSGRSIDQQVIYILLGIFAAMIVTSLVIMTIFLDPLEGQVKKKSKSLCMQLASVFRWFMDFKAVCLFGLMVYSLLQMAFIFGEFTKAFVTCPFGVHMVGYAMLTMSASSSASSYLSVKMVKYVGRPTVILTACALQLGQLMFMLVWTPGADDIIELLIFMGIWGVADGILFTQIVSIVGALFVDNKEPAFAGVKMCQSLGACFSLATAKYISCHIKICIIIGLLIIAMATYLVLEVTLWQQAAAEEAPELKKDDVKEKNGNGPTQV